jgi:hypothetical protein
MGIAVSLLLIALGAILAWGVTGHVHGLDVTAIGVIVLVIGLVGLILTMLFWHSWWGPGYARRSAYAAPGPGYGRRRWYGYGPWSRGGAVVEEEEVGPGPGPGGPPAAGPPY